MSLRKQTLTIKKREQHLEAIESLTEAKRFTGEMDAKKSTYRIRIPRLSAVMVPTHSPEVYLAQYKSEGAYIVEVIEREYEDEGERGEGEGDRPDD